MRLAARNHELLLEKPISKSISGRLLGNLLLENCGQGRKRVRDAHGGACFSSCFLFSRPCASSAPLRRGAQGAALIQPLQEEQRKLSGDKSCARGSCHRATRRHPHLASRCWTLAPRAGRRCPGGNGLGGAPAEQGAGTELRQRHVACSGPKVGQDAVSPHKLGEGRGNWGLGGAFRSCCTPKSFWGRV